MTATTVHEVTVLITIVLSMGARIIEEEEEEVDIAGIAVMTCVQGEIVRIAPVDAMMTAARMVARDVVVLTALQRLM
jgi:UDP-N-acetylglucosamine enolpyruvyl transferase